jgi:hypothetical protein
MGLEIAAKTMTAHTLPRRQLLSRHHVASRPRRASRTMLMLPFAAISLVVVAGGIFVWSVLWPTWPSGPVRLDAPAIPITVANVLFDVPPAAVRAAVQRHAGPHERIDLAFVWPSLTPPPPAGKEAAAATEDANSAAADTGQRVFVTIAGLGTVLPPAERLRTIYPRYVEAQATAGPGGLAVLPFRAGTPYEGEDLIYFAGNPEQFFARCTRPAGAVPGTCMHERLIDTAELTLRFPRSWLDDWRGVAAGADRLAAQLHPQAR